MGRQRNSAPTERWEFKSAVDMARALPQLFRPIASTPSALTREEREAFAQCEAAIDTLQWAFWAAGKALEIVREARLYRVEHPSFEAYAEDRWDMSEGQANRLIRTWRIAETLFDSDSNDPTPIGVARKLNQAQVWELVPVAEAWDATAAAHVYRSAARVDGVKVTAKVLQRAVGAVDLQAAFDAARVADEVRVGLTRRATPPQELVDPAAQAARAIPLQFVQRLAKKDAAVAGAYLDELQRQIDRCREVLLPPQHAGAVEAVGGVDA